MDDAELKNVLIQNGFLDVYSDSKEDKPGFIFRKLYGDNILDFMIFDDDLNNSSCSFALYKNNTYYISSIENLEKITLNRDNHKGIRISDEFLNVYLDSQNFDLNIGGQDLIKSWMLKNNFQEINNLEFEREFDDIKINMILKDNSFEYRIFQKNSLLYNNEFNYSTCEETNGIIEINKKVRLFTTINNEGNL